MRGGAMTAPAAGRGWWFRADAPAERLAALRIAIGAWACGYVVIRVPELNSLSALPARQFQPVGVVRALTTPLPGWLVVAIGFATAALLVAFTLGVAWRAVAPAAAAALLWTISYRNSWGITFHTEDLLVLHVIALAVTPAADAWALGPARGHGADAGYGWGVRLLATLTAATYLLAGIAKLRLAGASWLDGDSLRDQIAVDNLRKALLGDTVAPLAHVLLDHVWLLAALSAGDAGRRARRADRAARRPRRARVGGRGVGVPRRRRARDEHLVPVSAARTGVLAAARAGARGSRASGNGGAHALVRRARRNRLRS